MFRAFKQALLKGQRDISDWPSRPSLWPCIAKGALLDSCATITPTVLKRWATSKAGGVTRNGRTSNPKYLGLKKSGGQQVFPGEIIIRQRGTRFHPGDGVGMGRDHTIYATEPGLVRFTRDSIYKRQWINVFPKKKHDDLAGIIFWDRYRRNWRGRGKLRLGDSPEILPFPYEELVDKSALASV